jgi:hypothetical protein
MATRTRLVVVGYALTLAVQAAAWADESYVVTPNPAALSTATIGTNYSQTQSFSEPLGFSSDTFVQSPDVYWFTYVSDGKSAVRFDTLGSNFGQSSGGQVLGSTNSSEVAVYSTAGSLVAVSKNTVDLSGNPIPIYPTFSSSIGTVYGSQPGALGTNQYTPEGLSQVYFAPTASTNPNWTVKPNDPTPYTGWSAPGNSGNSQQYYPPSYYTSLNEYHVWSTALSPIVLDNNGNPVLRNGSTIPQPGWRYFDYERIGPGSTWNRYQVLPAGTYYIAVGSAQTFAGDTDAVTVLQQPIFYNYDTNQNGPAITSPLTGFQYYDDPTGLQNAGTINLNVTQAPVVTQNVTTLTGSANMTLNATTLVVSNGGSYSGVLSDGTFQGLLVVTGGTLTLTGNNTFSGGTTLSGSGTLSVGADANLGDPTGAITFDGGTLQITGTTYNSTTRPLYWDSNGGGFNVSDPGNTFTVNSTLSGGGLTKSGAGTLVLTQGYYTASPTVISAGTLQLTTTASNTAGISGAGNLTVASGASLVSDGITAAGLTVAGSVQIRTNGTATGTSKVSALTLTGSLDLTNNALIFEATPATKATALSTLQSEVVAGAGQLTGIFSSTLPANEAIAIVDNSLLTTPKTTFNGQSVDSSSIIVTPALIGDSNIDGKVDLSDLNVVLNNLGSITSAWAKGNFDHAATIDLTDLNDVLNHLGTSLPAGVVGGAVSAVPEPASLSILVSAAAGLMLARKKR